MNPGMDPVSARRQQLQAVEQAKQQLASIQGRTQMTSECIKVLTEAGAHPRSADAEPLLIAMCKVQLAQLRMSEAEGLAMIASLTEYINKSESPLATATMIPPTMRRH